MLMGYTLFAMCVAEVPVFFYTGALLKRVGIDVVLHVVLGCLVLRSLAYTAMPRFVGAWFAAPAAVDHVTALGLSDPEEMAAVAAAWRRWGADPGACSAACWFTALGWAP